MATFEYKAKTKEGEIRTGTVETSSREAALDVLQQNDLIVLALQEIQQKTVFNFSFKSKVRQKDIVIFSRQLATLFEARIPIVSSLKTLLSEITKEQFRSAIAEVTDDVSGGMALSQALSKHQNIFSPFYINLIRSGEESGKLQDIFSYLADYLERSYNLTNKARNALIYPAFILATFIGVFTVMLVVVFPRLIAIFEETGQAVPLYTQAIIFLSLFLQQWGLVLLGVIVVGVIFVWRWSYLPEGKLYMHRVQINLPILGGIYRKLYMARLTDNLKTLLASGIPILRALSISGDVIGNEVYRLALVQAADSVRDGSTISSAFNKIKEIPQLVTQMVRVGEAAGKLDTILNSVAKFYQKEVDSAFENLVALIEPALIVFLGVGVGILVASVLVPLYNLVGSI